MFDFLRRNTEPKVPEVVRVQNKEFQALVGGAMAAMHELQNLASHAKTRLAAHDRRPIVQADLEELLRSLADVKQRLDAKAKSDIAKSTDTSDTEWDQAGTNRFVTPVIQMATSPQAIIDLTLAAAKSGAKSAKLLYELVVAEMDVAVARFYVSLDINLVTKEQA